MKRFMTFFLFGLRVVVAIDIAPRRADHTQGRCRDDEDVRVTVLTGR